MRFNKLPIFVFTFILSSSAFASFSTKAYLGTIHRYSSNFNGPIVFGGEVGATIDKKIETGIGGYFNKAEANGYIGGQNGNALERKHYLYAYGDYWFLKNFSAGLQTGLTFQQENYDPGDPNIVYQTFTTTKAFAASLRIGVKTQISSNFEIGSIAAFSYFGDSGNPAVGIANNLLLSIRF